MGSKGRTILILILFTISTVIITQGSDSQGEGEWGYHDSFQIEGILRNLSETHPGITEFTTAQSLLGTRTIPGDRIIPILFVGDRSDSERTWIMIVGGHHGNEQDSVESVLAFADDLLKGYDEDEPRSVNIVEKMNLAILPVVNPYGLDMNTRFDENGEDPNRDYPFDPDPEGTPLTTAGAHAVHSLSKLHPFALAVSYHTGSKGVFTPWGADLPGSRSPDRACFQELSDTLVRSSGAAMDSGPANDYPGLGYLNGAFDDHLYGSTFLSDRLYDPNMILPRSTATATIELWNYKGENIQLAGDPADVWYPSEGGAVPIGMRMAYASCEIASPSMEVEKLLTGSNLTLEVKCYGFDEPGDIESHLIYHDQKISPTGIDAEVHDYMPEMRVTYTYDVGSVEQDAIIRVVATPDREWTQKAEDAYPDIAPQSLLSGSRIGEISWTGMLDITEGSDRDTDLIQDLYPGEVMAGKSASVMIDQEKISWPDFERLEIECSLNGLTNTIDYVNEDLFDPEDLEQYPVNRTFLERYPYLTFVTPVTSGYAKVDVTLVMDGNRYHDSTVLRVYPTVWVKSWSFTGGPGERSLVVNAEVQGVTSPSRVVYGINLYDGMRWGSGKWVGGPVNLQVFEDRSINIEMDVPMVRERVFFYISTSLEVPDGDPLKISPGYEIFASDLSVELVGDDVIFGPAVVLGYGESGLVEADGVVDGFTYSVEFRDDIGRRVESVELTWIPLFDLQEQEVKEVRLHAAEAGFDPEKITGAWMGEIESLDEGTYQYSGTITNGEYYTYPGSGFSGTRKGSDGDRIIGEVEVTDGDGDDYEFPWALVVFFFLIVIVVFIISIIRYPTHNREPEPDEKLVRPGSPGGTDVKRAGNLRSLSRDGTRRP